MANEELQKIYVKADMQYDALKDNIHHLAEENKQLKENYERIYNENCKLRENHNINDISLLDENEQLKEENKQLKKHHICVRPYTNDEVREKIDNYRDTIKQLFETIIDKQKRIDKAIEYIKNNWYSKNTRNIDELHSLGDWRLDLLEILEANNEQ